MTSSALPEVIPANERERLAVLHEYHILDTLPENDYDGLTFLAAQICGAPIALISLVDTDRTWFKSRYGLAATQMPREYAFCKYAILNPDEVFIVPDAREDIEMACKPQVTGPPHVRFYAGAPIVVSADPGGRADSSSPESGDRFALGTLCVLDHSARVLAPDQKRALQELSRQVANLLELRLQRIQQEETHRRLREAQSLAAVGSWEVDMATGTLLWSEENFRILGFDPAQGEPSIDRVFQRYHPEDRVSHREEVERAIADGIPYTRDMRIVLDDGTIRWVVTRGVGMREDHNGRIVRIQGTVQDITERKESEERLRNLSVELSRRNESLGDFASAASHDLKEPLRKIRMFGDRLRKRVGPSLAQSDPESLAYLDRMTGASERMQGLVEGLLALAVVSQRGEGGVQREPVALGPLISEVLSDLEARLQESGGSVIVTTRMPTICANPVQMRQLMQNLIGNALKFHKPGEPPSVRVAATLPPGKKEIVLSVSDSGIGFRAEDADRIFGTFQRLGGQYEGSGIGLSICRRIAEAHGGSIHAESEPGKGATFYVTLSLV